MIFALVYFILWAFKIVSTDYDFFICIALCLIEGSIWSLITGKPFVSIKMVSDK